MGEPKNIIALYISKYIFDDNIKLATDQMNAILEKFPTTSVTSKTSTYSYEDFLVFIAIIFTDTFICTIMILYIIIY